MKRILVGIAAVTMAMALVSCGGGGDGSAGLADAQAAVVPEQRANAKTEDTVAAQGLTAMRADSAGRVDAAIAAARVGSVAALPSIQFDASVESAPISVKFFERQTTNFVVDVAVKVRTALPSGALPYVADNEQDIIADWFGGNVSLWPDGPGAFRAPLGLPVNTKLPRGTYNGALEVKVCWDSCPRPYPTSTPPVLVPYSITVVPPFEVSVEVNGVSVPFQPRLNGGVRYIEVKNGDRITVRSSEITSWSASSSGVAFVDGTQTQNSWTTTPDLRTSSYDGAFTVEAMVLDHLPATYWAQESIDFRVTR